MTTREQWLNDFAKAAGPAFEAAGFPLPSNVRMSVGFPSTGTRGKRIGECWSAASSADGQFEIFVHPTLADSSRIADVITHELVHAAVGLKAGHGPAFRKCATALGLVGKMTATTAGPGWRAWAEPILKTLGPIPHASLAAGSSSSPRKQAARMIKCECDRCGFTFRAARSWIASAASLACPDYDCQGPLTVG